MTRTEAIKLVRGNQIPEDLLTHRMCGMKARRESSWQKGLPFTEGWKTEGEAGWGWRAGALFGEVMFDTRLPHVRKCGGDSRVNVSGVERRGLGQSYKFKSHQCIYFIRG